MTVDTIISELALRDLLGALDDVCRVRRVTRDEICSRRRTKAVASARHELWWRLRHHPDLAFSYVEIGRLFDRDHSSVLAGVRSHERTRRDVDGLHERGPQRDPS